MVVPLFRTPNHVYHCCLEISNEEWGCISATAGELACMLLCTSECIQEDFWPCLTPSNHSLSQLSELELSREATVLLHLRSKNGRPDTCINPFPVPMSSAHHDPNSSSSCSSCSRCSALPSLPVPDGACSTTQPYACDRYLLMRPAIVSE